MCGGEGGRGSEFVRSLACNHNASSLPRGLPHKSSGYGGVADARPVFPLAGNVGVKIHARVPPKRPVVGAPHPLRRRVLITKSTRGKMAMIGRGSPRPNNIQKMRT